MKSTNLLKIAIIFIVIFIASACSKERETENIDSSIKNYKSGNEGYYTEWEFISTEGVIYTYYFNGVQRKMSEFNPEGENTSSFASLAVYNNSGSLIGVKINEFSTRELYYLFGDRIGRDLRKLDNFTNEVTTHAETSGEISYYERTGDISQSFSAWYEQQLLLNYPEDPKSPFTVFKEAWEPSAAWFSTTGKMLVMPPGWNNVVSRFYSLHIYGLTSFYDWTFYRRHMHTFIDFGWHTVRFIGPLSYLNDRTSSCFDV